MGWRGGEASHERPALERRNVLRLHEVLSMHLPPWMNRPATPPQSASTIWYQARVSATKTRSAADHSATSSARRTSDAASSTKSIVPG